MFKHLVDILRSHHVAFNGKIGLEGIALKFEGSVSYELGFLSTGQRKVSVSGETPYWGLKVAKREKGLAHYGIPLLGTIELRWE